MDDVAVRQQQTAPEGARVMAVGSASVTVFVPGAGLRPFTFERVFNETTGQDLLYKQAAQGSVVAALNGFNACLFVYGQTGSGKTHTVFGPPGTLDGPSTTDDGNPSSLVPSAGLALRACKELLEGCDSMPGTRASLSVQYVEIYQEQITDLVSGSSVALRSASTITGTQQFVLSGAVESTVASLSDVMDLLRAGERRKQFASTRMNARSSRAHTVLVVKITQARDGELVTSHLHLVDLAGCEQLRQSGAMGKQMKEVSTNPRP